MRQQAQCIVSSAQTPCLEPARRLCRHTGWQAAGDDTRRMRGGLHGCLVAAGPLGKRHAGPAVNEPILVAAGALGHGEVLSRGTPGADPMERDAAAAQRVCEKRADMAAEGDDRERIAA